MIDQLYQYFNRYVPLSHQEVEAFCHYLEQKTYSRKAYLLEEGETCHHNFFISIILPFGDVLVVF